MLVLGIESTCDEMAAAVVEDGVVIHTNVVASQDHRRYGGVFPELAARTHVDQLLPVLSEALVEAVDLVAVAKGPGLVGPLLVGLTAAKGLALAWDKPFVGVNHVEAHLYAAMMGVREWLFPALGIVISGGHTIMVKIKDVGVYEMIGRSVDDAIGEAFDKVAALLGLPYPGGPAVEAMAKNGDAGRFAFRAGEVKHHPWDFSFSGLKTQVLYAVKGQNGKKGSESVIAEKDKPDIAAAFQEAALGAILAKAREAVQSFDCKTVYVGGGVSNNRRLRALFEGFERPVFWPPAGLSLDNAAMIAGLGYHVYKRQGGDRLDLEAVPILPLSAG